MKYFFRQIPIAEHFEVYEVNASSRSEACKVMESNYDFDFVMPYENEKEVKSFGFKETIKVN